MLVEEAIEMVRQHARHQVQLYHPRFELVHPDWEPRSYRPFGRLFGGYPAYEFVREYPNDVVARVGISENLGLYFWSVDRLRPDGLIDAKGGHAGTIEEAVELAEAGARELTSVA